MAPDTPELELWTTISLHVGAGNRIGTSAKQRCSLTIDTSPASARIFKLHIWLALFSCDNTAIEAADLTIC